MKKIIIGVIITIASIWLVLFIKDIPKYRFGYFVEGPELKYEHSIDGDILKLDNGDVLVLGDNKTPSEIYNTKNNRFEIFELPTNISYKPKGILLKNNRLLLTYVTNPNNPKKVKYDSRGLSLPPYKYDSMATIDLNTMQIEKIIQKKINIKYRPSENGTKFIQLGNDNILIIDLEDEIAESYNPVTNTSKSFNIKTNKGFEATIIAQGKDKALIFGPTKISLEQYQNTLKFGDMDSVLEYNDLTKTVKPVGKALWREFPLLKRINTDEILILGGKIAKSTQVNLEECGLIEIYNTKTNTTKIITKLLSPKERLLDERIDRTSFDAAPINNDLFLIAGGNNGGKIAFNTRSKTSEILDTKTYNIFEGPNMIKPTDNHRMIKLNNGDILLIGSGLVSDIKKTQIFRKVTK